MPMITVEVHLLSYVPLCMPIILRKLLNVTSCERTVLFFVVDLFQNETVDLVQLP